MYCIITVTKLTLFRGVYMKKKIIVLLLMVALLATIFSGCTLIKENKERAANEVLATVTEDGITLSVTRNELLAYTNYMLNQYSQYEYQPDLNTLLPEILDYMINQKYLVIKGITYLKGLPHRQDVMVGNINKNISIDSPEGVLTLAERYSSIKSVNKTFEKEIDGYVEAYDLEQKNLAISAAKEEIATYQKQGYSVTGVDIVEGSYKEEYIQDEKANDAKAKIEITLKKGDREVSVIMPVAKTMYDEDGTFSTELSQEEQGKKVVEKNIVLVYEEPVLDAEGNTDYKTHKTDTLTYRVVVPRGTTKKEEEKNEEEGIIKDRYKAEADIDADNKANIFDYEIATTASLKEAYRQFREAKKSMLINFEEDGLDYYYRNQFESEVLSAVKHELARVTDKSSITKELVELEYNILVQRQQEEYALISTDAAKLQKFQSSLASGSVNLTQVYYAPISSIEAEGYNIEEFFAIAHILFKFDDVQNSFMNPEKPNRDEDSLKSLRYETAQYTETSRSNPNFDIDYICPLHTNNDGECSYDGEGICPALAFDPDNLVEKLFGDNGIYNRISTDIAAAVTAEEKLQVFKDYMVLYNDDGGAISSDTGYLITPEGINHSYDGDDFPGLAWQLYKESNAVGSAFLSGDNLVFLPGEHEGATLGYCFTSYGIHLMMISFIPFDDPAAIDDNGVINIDMPLDSKGTTHRQLLQEKLISAVESASYTEFTKTNSMEKSSAAANKDTKRFKKLMKDLGIK